MLTSFSPHKPLLATQLIGRATPLATLQEAVQVVPRRRGVCFLLAGEAGIGKSRLTTEARTLAQQNGFVIVQGNCYEPDHSLPYAPWLDLLRDFCARHDDAELIHAFGDTLPELARLRPQLHTLISTPIPPAPLTDPEQEKRQLFTALFTFLTRLAETAPLLVVIEDLHWCDDTSLEFLQLLARRGRDLPLLLLLTYRNDELTPPLRHLLAELDRGRCATELTLSRLSLNDTQAMIAAIFEQEYPIQTEFVAAIHHLTDGNPFFIEETLKALVTAGDIFQAYGRWTRKPIAELHIPRSVEDAVQRRTRQLSPPAQALLQLAAVAGRRFDFNLLQTLTNHSEAELLALMKTLIGAQLVVEETADRFAFRHALTRQAVYHQLLRRERRTLHQTIAQTLEQLAAGGLDVPLGDLAYHFFEAESWDKARDYAWQAGEEAQKLFAPRAAAEQFSRAITACEQAGQTPAAALYQARAQAYDRLSHFEQARADYEQAHRLARQQNEPEMAWQALLNLGFLWVGQEYHQAGIHLEQALQLARQMNRPAILGQTLNRVGNWHLMTERDDLSIPYHQEALTLFQQAGNRWGMAHSLDLLGISHFMHGDMVMGAHYYEQAIPLWRELGERQWLVSSLATYATRGGNGLFPFATTPSVPLTQCVTEVQEAIHLAQTIGWLNGEAAATTWYAILLAPRGEFQAALATGQTALALAEQLEHNLWLDTVHCLLGIVYRELGHFVQAEHYLQRALQGAKAARSITVIHTMSGNLARVYIAQGRLDEAEALLAEVITPDMPLRMQGQQLVRWAQAELMLARQTPSVALPIVEQLLSALPGTDPPVVPALWLLWGEVLLAMERYKEAEKVLAAAADAAANLDHLPVLWRTQATLARLYQARKQLKAMEQAAVQARQVITTLADKLTQPDLRQSFLQMAELQLPVAAARRTASFGGLTRREHEVATLVSQGLSNAVIAETLVLSERTIEKHVENIMNKLGFDSRVQIAAWVVSQQSVASSQ